MPPTGGGFQIGVGQVGDRRLRTDDELRHFKVDAVLSSDAHHLLAGGCAPKSCHHLIIGLRKGSEPS